MLGKAAQFRSPVGEKGLRSEANPSCAVARLIYHPRLVALVLDGSA